jgi:uncharacterized membrane protein YkvA (DUF1232 family)
VNIKLDKDYKDVSKYVKYYSDGDLFKKIIKVGKKASIKVIYVALLLYFTLKKSSTPKWAKAQIIGALGYFIFPVDAIPDIIPVAGYSDDLGILILALGAVAMYIDDDAKNDAKSKLRDWFGNYDDKYN